ncbi:MAG: ABC transporter substrate-binding protein [Flavobacteriales bacterium CG_4_9_14_3_um_filter_32_8]|nr:MAG: ABC transporter substrate-binding protein [Flavobacteriales bacterium CG_4_9_14_3_um_filter_32_8]
MQKKLKVRVSAVSYLNTLPFLFGIYHSNVINEIELSVDIPSVCAKKLLANEVDLGLVPVAILPQLKEYHIISDYCIGAEGKVASVMLYSDVPLNEIKAIYLDYQSKTSINLVQLLAKEYWKINPKWLKAATGYENKIDNAIAGVIIGDRTFNLPKVFNYQYDLAEEWKKHTDLPFVFACWVANKKLTPEFITNFNSALKKGIDNIKEVVTDYKDNNVNQKQLYDYLSNKISYPFNKNKQQALTKFLNYIEEKEKTSFDF